MAIELIAEVSSNHGGDLELAKAFIWAYAEAGADWVKFQSYQVATLRPDDPQRSWLAQAELSDEAHHILQAECARAQVQFLTTIFHVSRLDFLVSLGLAAVKVGSGESTDVGLGTRVTTSFPRTFISMGLHPRPALWQMGADLLHCVSRYPCPTGAVARSYTRPFVGWSDHCRGVDACETAIVSGARVIEKHVSLPAQRRDRRSWEADVEQFRRLRQFADDDPQRYLGRWGHTPTP